MFSFDPSFDAPLVPQLGDWPLFDEVVMCSLSPFSTSSSLTTSPSVQSDALPPAFSSVDLASMPIPPSRASQRNKNPDHIPRPRNAFMLFRSAFAAAQKISAKIEHDNRHITRIIANCWNRLSDAEKQVWHDKAAAEKAQHKERYPNYRFSPVGRTKKPKKRQVRRNGEMDVKRCTKVADLVMAGKCGSELELAMNEIDIERGAAQRSVGTELDVFTSDEKRTTLFVLDPPPQGPDADDVPPFRSPLLPPANTTPQQVTDEHVMPQPLVTTQIEPQTFTPPTGMHANTPHDDLNFLFHPPSYQFYQPNDSAPPPAQSAVAFVQSGQNNHPEPEQSVPGFSVFTWNQSDFSYYH